MTASVGEKPRSAWASVTPMMLFSCFCLLVGDVLFGYDTASFGGILANPGFLRQFATHNPKTDTYAFEPVYVSLLSSLAFIGKFIGCLIAGPSIERFGHRTVFFALSIISIAGVIIEITAADDGVGTGRYAQFIVGRIIVYISVGLVEVDVTTYQSEIVPPALRGSVVISLQLFLNVGAIIAVGLNKAFSTYTSGLGWKIITAIQFVFPVFIIIFSFFIPHSPRWLLSKDREEEALAALKRLRPKADVEDGTCEAEIHTIRAALQEHVHKGPWVDLFRHVTSHYDEGREAREIRYTLRVAVASYCHSDTLVRAGGYKTKLPCTPSHEGAGTIVALGASARKQGFEVGQRVMCGMPLHPCAECAECNGPAERRQYCPNIDGFIGITVDGCFAEYVKADARFTSRLPPSIGFLSAAPFACAGRTVWRGVDQTGLSPGQQLAIIGSGGGLGHLGVKFGKAKGFRVFGIDARDEGLALSREYGADIVVDARKGKEAVVEEVRAATGEEGVDATVCVSDHWEAASIACGITKRHGIVIQIAQPKDVIIPYEELIVRDIQIRGSMIASFAETESMISCVVENKIKVQINKFDGLDKVQDMVDAVSTGKVKGKCLIIVDPQQVKDEIEE